MPPLNRYIFSIVMLDFLRHTNTLTYLLTRTVSNEWPITNNWTHIKRQESQHCIIHEQRNVIIASTLSLHNTDIHNHMLQAVASLRSVSPGVVNDITLFTSKVMTFFTRRPQSDYRSLVIVLQTTVTNCTLSAFPGDCLSSVLENSSTKNILNCY